MYKKKEFESIFIKVINPKSKNLIIGWIYRHPSMNTNEFIDVYMSDVRASKMDFKLEGTWNVENYCRPPWLADKKNF